MIVEGPGLTFASICFYALYCKGVKFSSKEQTYDLMEVTQLNHDRLLLSLQPLILAMLRMSIVKIVYKLLPKK